MTDKVTGTIEMDKDPRHQRFHGVTWHGSIEFDVPYMTQLDENLWHGGCTTGLILPADIAHVVSLYPWERYTVEHDLQSELYIRMRDASDQGVDLVYALAEWIDTCRETGPVLVHCFPDGTLVGGILPTAIENANNVIGMDGRTHRVTYHHLDPYDGPLSVIKTTGALDIKSTPEHPIRIVRPYRFPSGFVAKPGMRSLSRVGTALEHYAQQPVWMPASQVRAGDFVVSPRPRFDTEPQNVQWVERPGHFNLLKVGEIQPDSDTAWMLGFYAADGSTLGENSIGFTLSLKDDVDRLVKVWANLGLIARVINHTNYVRVIVNSRTVSTSFREWFGSSDQRRLPAFVFTHGFPIKDVLAGYVDGDGYTERDQTITCQTISKTLVEQIRMAALSIKLSPTVSEVRRHSGYPNAKPAWKIQWRKNATQHHTTWWRGWYLMPVTSVTTEHYSGNIHNIAVEDAETYTVNGVLVHNCQAGLNRSSLVIARVLYNNDFGTGAEIVDHLRAMRSPAVLCNETFEAEVVSWGA